MRRNKRKGKGLKNNDNIYHRCGMNKHCSCTCHMPKHVADFYQASLKEKGKHVEINFVDYYMNTNHLDISDFFENLDETN